MFEPKGTALCIATTIDSFPFQGMKAKARNIHLRRLAGRVEAR